MPDSKTTVPELYFLKYKGVLSPWEILDQAKRIGFKCKKYANWAEVHVSESSKQLLKAAGDSLIDSAEFDIAAFPEISQIWEKVQRWRKDPEGFSLEPDLLEEYEQLSRLVEVASVTPNMIDIVLQQSGVNIENISIESRWVLFLSDCILKFFEAKKRRYQLILSETEEMPKIGDEPDDFIDKVAAIVTDLYLRAGFDTSSFESEEVISLFIRELGLSAEPVANERLTNNAPTALPRVWVEKFEGSPVELVKFRFSDGDIFVKVNRLNRVLNSNSEIGRLLSNDQYWMLVGKSIESHVSQIDEIQDFFNTFARNLRSLA